MCICISSVSHLRSYQTYVLNHVRLYHLGQQLGVAWCMNVGGTAFGWTWLLNACWNLKFHKQEKQAWRRQTTAAASGEAWHFTLCGKKKKSKKESKNMFSSLYGYFLMTGCPSQTSLHSWCAEFCACSQHCVHIKDVSLYWLSTKTRKNTHTTPSVGESGMCVMVYIDILVLLPPDLGHSTTVIQTSPGVALCPTD